VRNYRPVAIIFRDKLDRLLFEMINLFAFIIFICSACIVLASEREFGHPLFRTCTAHDYGEGVGQMFAITEDPQGRMLFGCEDAILVFDNNRWETIETPGTGFIRSFAADRDGVSDEKVEGKPVVWIAGDYGLMRVFLGRPTFSKRQFAFHPSQIVTADGKPIPIHDGKELTLEYDDRDFQVGFGTDHFSVGNALYYHATLEGKVGHRWPAITAPVWRSGALNKAHYLFSVEANDSDGVEGKALRLAFTIVPPWYRPLWMKSFWEY
jgi:hypothetical protein